MGQVQTKDFFKNFPIRAVLWMLLQMMLQWGFSVISTGFTVWFGRIYELHWFLIWLSSIFVLACTITITLRFDEWRYRTKVDGKLIISKVFYTVRNIDSESACMCLGFVFSNEATFPIVFNDIKVETKLAGYCPQQNEYIKKQHEIPAKREFYFPDHDIEVIRLEQNKILAGTVDVSVKYGRAHSIKYEFHQRKKVFLRFDAQNNITYWDWIDL